MADNLVVELIACLHAIEYLSLQCIRGGGHQGDGLVVVGIEVGLLGVDCFQSLLLQGFEEKERNELLSYLQRVYENL